FEAAMEEARTRSAGSKVGEEAVGTLYLDLTRAHGAVTFLGYETELASSEVLSLIREGNETDVLVEGQVGEVTTRATPFYAEAGGQVGDKGVIRSPEGVFLVTDTRRPVEGWIVHRGRVEKGRIVK